MADSDPPLAFDHLPEPGASLEVVTLDHANYGSSTDDGPRRPHRHDYHELIWTRSGSGRHLIDGEPSVVQPGTITVIARGQVHVFEEASDLSGSIVRFGEELLRADAAGLANPAWLVGSRTATVVPVPPGDAPSLEFAIAALADEARRPRDVHSLPIARHLLSAVLLWIERWFAGTRPEGAALGDGDLELYRRFLTLLERDFARHQDAVHYADELRVPQAALSRALGEATGHTTKELITDRRMLEAARLLRFTELTVGETAYAAGYGDQLYFSRAFKRRYGEAPSAYRERMRGRAPADP